MSPTYSPDPLLSRHQRAVDASLAELDPAPDGPDVQRRAWLVEVRDQHPELTLVSVPERRRG